MRFLPRLNFEYLALSLLFAIALSLHINMESTNAQDTPANMQTLNCMEVTTTNKLPTTSRTLSTFRKIKAETSVEEIVQLVGCPDADIGSGIHIYIYQLIDNSQVWIGTPGQGIFYVDHRRDGELIERLLGDMPPAH